MVNESSTDVFIMRLLDDAGIEFTYQGAKTKPIQDALKTASKSGKEQPGYPEFVCEDEIISLQLKKYLLLDVVEMKNII